MEKDIPNCEEIKGRSVKQWGAFDVGDVEARVLHLRTQMVRLRELDAVGHDVAGRPPPPIVCEATNGH